MNTTTTAAADGVQAIIDTAHASAVPAKLELGQYYTLVSPRGDVREIDLTGDKYHAAPQRKDGVTTTWDVPSFLAYYEKHSDDATEVFANAQELHITAVLDAHAADAARWSRHRLHLALRKTPAWLAWERLNGQYMDQEVFAEHLEDRQADLVNPTAAEMLEVAQSLQSTTKTEFRSAVSLQSGKRQFTFAETGGATAGVKGTLEVPTVFTVGLYPFEGSEGFEVTARFRYRVTTDGKLRLAYKLERPEDTLGEAFKAVLAAVAAGVGTPVMNGAPARSA